MSTMYEVHKEHSSYSYQSLSNHPFSQNSAGVGRKKEVTAGEHNQSMSHILVCVCDTPTYIYMNIYYMYI
jgi:hypothetical protein